MPRGKSVKPSAPATTTLQKEAFGGPAPSNFGDGTNQFENNCSSFNAFGNQGMDFDFTDAMFDNMEDGAFGGHQEQAYMDANMFNTNLSDVDYAKLGQFGLGSHGNMSMNGQFAPQNTVSAQSGIVNQRRDQVREQFGQITPPDDTTPEVDPKEMDRTVEHGQKSKDEIAKLDRAQRARNAANKRHSKSKRKDSAMDAGAEGGETELQGKATSLQREKNRVAAAKCRAKKKATSEEMQDVHREGSKTNTMLHREMRELRDQKAFLRNTLLQHEPGLCQCHAIHCFNFAQAQQLAMGVGGMIPQAMSPLHDSASSVATPGSESSGAKRFSMSGPSAERPNVGSRAQSFGNAMGQDFSEARIQDQTQMGEAGEQDFLQMSESQFNDFLQQNSPSSHPGFS